MTDETDATNLFLRADDKIEKIRAEVTELIKQDLGMDHKMDLVIQQQAQLKEGFGYSRETGHKTWEAVQKMSALMEKMDARVTIAESSSSGLVKMNEKMEHKFDKYILGIGVTVFCSILLTVMAFLIKWKP